MYANGLAVRAIKTLKLFLNLELAIKSEIRHFRKFRVYLVSRIESNLGWVITLATVHVPQLMNSIILLSVSPELGQPND